jgi:hypothetical protein
MDRLQTHPSLIEWQLRDRRGMALRAYRGMQIGVDEILNVAVQNA